MGGNESLRFWREGCSRQREQQAQGPCVGHMPGVSKGTRSKVQSVKQGRTSGKAEADNEQRKEEQEKYWTVSDSAIHTIEIERLEYLRRVAKKGLSEMIFTLKSETRRSHHDIRGKSLQAEGAARAKAVCISQLRLP